MKAIIKWSSVAGWILGLLLSDVQAVQVVDVNTTWSGIVNLTQDVVVSNQAVLTIEPGTQVVMATNDAGPSADGMDPDRIELIVMDGSMTAEMVDFYAEGGAAAGWYGIALLTNSSATIHNSDISDAIRAIRIENCKPAQVFLDNNLITHICGVSGTSNIFTTFTAAVGIYIAGPVGEIGVSNNVLCNFFGGTGGAGTNGAAGVNPSEAGGAGGPGRHGGDAIGIMIYDGANPLVVKNLITNMVGGASGAGGVGGAGAQGATAPDAETSAGNGGAGGTGGSSGRGGNAYGIVSGTASPIIYHNTIRDIFAGADGGGSAGGAGGGGGMGYYPDSTNVNGTAGGNGWVGGSGGSPWSGGDAFGMDIHGDGLPSIYGNTISNIVAGAGGLGGAGGMGGGGGWGGGGGTASARAGGMGGNGGEGGPGAPGSMGGPGGNAVGLWVDGGSPTQIRANKIRVISAGNGGNGGEGGLGGVGGVGGNGGNGAADYTDGYGGNGGNGGIGREGASGGAGGTGGRAIGISLQSVAANTVVANNDVMTVTAGGAAGAGNAGAGGPGGLGGAGGNNGTGGGTGRGGDGGAGGDARYGSDGGSAGLAALVSSRDCAPEIVHNTFLYSAAAEVGTLPTGPSSFGTGGAAGAGTPPGSPGSASTTILGTPGVPGMGGLGIGVYVTNSPAWVCYNIFEGVMMSNAVGVFSDLGIWAGAGACDYNNMRRWATNYVGFVPAHTHDISVEPFFVSIEDHRLQGTSGCIDIIPEWAAKCQSIDFNGVTRPLDGNNSGVKEYDIGAYEYASPVSDTDHDGLSDAAEVYVGTDAGGTESCFRLLSVQSSGVTNVLTWSSVEGKEYDVQYCTSLVESNWVTLAIGEVATAPSNTYTAVNETGTNSLCYRIVVP